MFKKIILAIIILSTILFLLTPAMASAGIVPCGRECVKWKYDTVGGECITAGTESDGTSIPINEAQPCSLCHVFLMLQILLRGTIIALFAFAAIIVVVGGITIMVSSGIPEQASKGKKIITYAIIGVIIALVSWVIINETMLLLVGPGTGKGVQKLPWPWDKISCIPSAPPEEEEEEEEETNEDRYCICERPIYTVNPSQYPDNTIVIGTSLKGTELGNADECEQRCVSANASTYCLQHDFITTSNLYCASKNDLKAKDTSCMKLEDRTNNTINIACFATGQDCAFSVLPDKSQFNKEYAKKCWVDGNFYCECTSREATWCNSSKPYGLYAKKREENTGYYWKAYDCIRYCGIYEGDYCRTGRVLNQDSEEPDNNNCDAVRNQYSCFGNYQCVNMIEGQVTSTWTACDELKEFLGCMAKYLTSAPYRIISSIADNSGGACFNNNTWDERGKCEPGEDSCTGECCAHKKYSFHYGGRGASAKCERCSWAVDFAINPQKQVSAQDPGRTALDAFKDTATTCNEELVDNIGDDATGKTWKQLGWQVRKKDVIGEGNHIHIELEIIANKHGCQGGE